MPLIPLAPTPISAANWGAYVERANDEIEHPDAVYSTLDQSDHPGCQVVTGITNTGGESTTGYVECGNRLVRRVTQVERQD